MEGYVFRGVKYYPRRFVYGNYQIDYEIFEKDGLWFAQVESCLERAKPVVFSSKSRLKCHNLIKSWFKSVVDGGSVSELIQKGYDVSPAFADVLYSVREMAVGYHVSRTENRESILEKGLVPNGTPDDCVLMASRIIDSVKPKHIPDWVKRQDVVYAYPDFSNFMLANKNYAGCDLYAVKLQPERCWVGSSGIGGLCLFYEDMTPEEQKLHAQSIRKKEGKLYWKYSCSLEEYVLNGRDVQKKDRAYGLDEVLILHKVLPTDVVLIGFWNNDGVFFETEYFKDFVREKFKECYCQILQKYKEIK